MASLTNDVAPKRRQQKRSSDKVANILRFALLEFAEHGYASASTRQIAEQVGIAHQLLLYHFGTKDNLWRQVILGVAEYYRDWYLAQIAAAEGLAPGAKLRQVQAAFVRFAAANPQVHSILTHRTGHSDERLAWMVSELLQPILDIITPLIRDAQASGDYVEGDPIHLQYAFMGTVTRVFQLAPEVQALTGRSSLDPDFVETHVELCLRLFFHKS